MTTKRRAGSALVQFRVYPFVTLQIMIALTSAGRCTQVQPLQSPKSGCVDYIDGRNNGPAEKCRGKIAHVQSSACDADRREKDSDEI
ncbi:hypothetical protein BC567DRAFT_51526 [Phyllosticta citribraziliensis]